MATIRATAAVETFFDAGHVDEVVYVGGPYVISKPGLFPNGAIWLGSDANFVNDSIYFDQMLSIIRSFGQGQYDFIVRANDAVDYSFSNAAIRINMTAATTVASGGFAEGDVLVEISEVIGSSFNDVIRGSDTVPDGGVNFILNGINDPFETSWFISNPGDNVLVGGGGNDVLEGRSGADILIGGSFTSDFGFDYASYESSPSGVTVRLKGVGSDTQTAVATGGDAAGDTLVGIEGLIGSRFRDTLTGNSLDNTLAGGLGSDVLDGKGGTDTADYSHDHFFDIGGTADQVVVRLGLNGANGTGAESQIIQGSGGQAFNQVSVDTLISIENVIGTNGADTIIGNEKDNQLDGRGGNDLIDGGFGNDLLIGGTGSNTVSYASHDTTSGTTGQLLTISLGLNGADGQAIAVVPFGRVFLPVETDVLRGFNNVIGSNTSETINGNELDNVIMGRGGNDKINGGDGDDTYVFSDFGSSLALFQGNNTYFDESGAGDTVRVRSFSDIVKAEHIGSDLLVTMKNGSFRIVDHFDPQGAEISEHAIERIADPTGSMVLATGLVGGNGSGIIAGTDGSETLDGRGGDDFLFGGNGADRLIGGDGNDRLTGGKGSDTFVFGSGFGNDVITDFTPGGRGEVDSHGLFEFSYLQGESEHYGRDSDFGHGDRIEFDSGVFHNFREVLAASRQVGNDTVITLNDHDSITLKETSLHSLHANDFLFI